MKVSTEFSKYAAEYNSHNIIQEKVVKKLISDIKKKPQYILDLGCGSGALCRALPWEYKHFIGIDFAAGMLELHPKSEKIEAIYGDFNDSNLFSTLQTYQFDHIFSASALQWAEDLDSLLKNMAALHTSLSLAIFTSGTFKTLNKTAGTKPLLRNKNEIERLIKLYFDVKLETVEYKLKFKSVREMFRYIKQSGVSGSRNLLSFKEMKELMRNYPLDYLEFEVLFIQSS